MERKVAEDQKREQFRNKVYIACKSIARENYHANWDHACAVQLKACLVGTKEGSVGAQICRNNWGSPDCKSTVDTSLWSLKDWDSCMLSKSLEASGCSLPKHAAESVNSRYKQEQERCAAEARLGVQ